MDKIEFNKPDSEVLKEFRKAHQYTQQELAKILDFPQQAIAMVETGKRNAPDSLKLKIIRYFKVDFDELKNTSSYQIEITDKVIEACRGESSNSVKIPFYHVFAAAGSGETSPDYPESDVMYFDKRWLENVIGVKPENVSIIQAKGDSMNGGSSPIKDGDLLMVDTSDIEPVNNQKFVVRLSNQDLVVKRISKDWQGNIILCSDNPQFDNIIPTDTDTFSVIGRVVWNGSKDSV